MSQDLLAALLGLDNHSADDVVREDYVRAAFGYPGSKARSVLNILPHLPYTDMYCEPFGGSGAVLLARNESKLEIFNDRYSGVTAFFRVIKQKDTYEEFTRRIDLMVHSREEFVWARNTWKNCDDIIERAARWYYVVRNSFGAQCLYFGRSRNPKALFANKWHSGLQDLYPIHNRVANCQIENLDWRVCFNDYNRPECVWYLDPPYYKVATGMYECEFQESEHIELLERIQGLDGFVAISSYPNDLYDKYEWDKRVVWEQGAKSLGMAFTGSNRLGEYKETLKRKVAMEVLYIRHAKHLR
jgi:DNA adenine methylase